MEILKNIIRRAFNENILTAKRFPTGNCHFVFDVTTENGRNIVVRIAKPENRNFLQSAIYWNRILESKGIPIAEILVSDLVSMDFPYIILERLEGKDLGLVYPKLSKFEKRVLAKELAEIQMIVSTLPKANGFGFLESYETNVYCRTWSEVLRNSLGKSRNRIKSAGIFEPGVVDKVEENLSRFENYFSQIQPIAFLDDITTKNVILHKGKLSGIVDVDWVCFGDSLFTIALTRMSLLLSNYESDYIDFWCQEIDLNSQQKRVLDFYTALFCIDFMSEIGKTFNKETPLEISQEKTRRLHSILRDLLASI